MTTSESQCCPPASEPYDFTDRDGPDADEELTPGRVAARYTDI